MLYFRASDLFLVNGLTSVIAAINGLHWDVLYFQMRLDAEELKKDDPFKSL